MMKELDSNFIDIKLQIPNFIGSKVIRFQSETIFSQNFKIQNFDPPKKIFGIPLDPQIFILKMSMVYLFVKKFGIPISNGVQMGASRTAHFSGG